MPPAGPIHPVVESAPPMAASDGVGDVADASTADADSAPGETDGPPARRGPFLKALNGRSE
jgi:hypothetical protein